MASPFPQFPQQVSIDRSQDGLVVVRGVVVERHHEDVVRAKEAAFAELLNRARKVAGISQELYIETRAERVGTGYYALVADVAFPLSGRMPSTTPAVPGQWGVTLRAVMRGGVLTASADQLPARDPLRAWLSQGGAAMDITPLARIPVGSADGSEEDLADFAVLGGGWDEGALEAGLRSMAQRYKSPFSAIAVLDMDQGGPAPVMRLAILERDTLHVGTSDVEGYPAAGYAEAAMAEAIAMIDRSFMGDADPAGTSPVEPGPGGIILEVVDPAPMARQAPAPGPDLIAARSQAGGAQDTPVVSLSEAPGANLVVTPRGERHITDVLNSVARMGR